MREITVLIADEHTRVAALLAQGLGRAPGFRVLAHTSNPLVAAELAHLMEPDIILADFERRGDFEVEMYRWLSRAAARSRLVVLTSSLRNGDEQSYRDAGAVLCLLKGLPRKELAQRLREVAGEHAASPDGMHRRHAAKAVPYRERTAR